MIDPGAPVTAAAEFIGQGSLVRRVFSRVGAERPQSVAVIGGSRSGKTSLLNHLADSSVARSHLRDFEKYLFFEFRAAKDQGDDPDSFLSCFSERLGVVVPPGTNRYEELRGKIEELHGSGMKLVALLDDFHFVTTNEHFPLEFFSFLRSMANNYNVAYVTTSILELQRLCSAKEVQESPFFNIFTNMHLGMLSPDDAQSLLAGSSKCGAPQAARLAAWCGGSPFILKVAASRVEEGALGESNGDAEYDTILSPSLVPYFSQVLSFLPPQAARPLGAISRGKSPNESESYHLAPLIKQGFLRENVEGIEVAIPAFACFLRSDFAPRMLTGSC